jgi:hypothetical protein
MSYKLTGTIKVKGETVQVSEKFSRRELVITDNSSMYPQDIQMQFTQDKCSLLDLYEVGQVVEVSFNLQGKAWQNPQGETKYFNTLNCWRIEKATPPASDEPAF